MVVRGAPGTGRTALLAAAREKASAAGTAVGCVRCVEDDAAIPHAAARRLAESLSHLGGRPEPRELVGRILAAAAEAPLFVTIDDAQWADDESLELLVLLALAPAAPGLTVVAAVRDGDPAASREAVAALRRVACDEVTLRPLTQSCVTAVARAAWSRPRGEVCAALYERTAGLPLLVEAVIGGIGPGAPSATAVASAVPASVRRFASEQLRRHDADARALADAVAVAGPCSVHLAARVGGIPFERAQRAADALASAALLGDGEPLRYLQPIVGDAVRAALPAFARSAAHARAAALLDADGAPVAAVAAHLIETSPRGDAHTVAVLREAARSAVDEGRQADAGRLLARAAAEPPPAQHRFETLLELGSARLAAGDDDPARPLAEALRRPGATPSAREWHQLARLLISSGDPAGAAAAAERGDAAAPDPAESEVLLASSFAVGMMRPPFDDATRGRLDAAASAATAGRLPDAPALRAALALHLASTNAPAADVERIALSAFATSPLVDDDRLGGPLSFAAGALVMVDSPAVAALLDEAVGTASLRGRPAAAAAAAGWRALVSARAGRIDDARADAEHAFGIDVTRYAPHLMLAAPALADAFLDAGEPGDATAVLARLERRTPMRLHARGGVALAEGDTARALRYFEAAGAVLDGIGVTSPAIAPWRSSAALAAHRLGRVEDAQALAAAEVVIARAMGAPRPLAVALRAAGLVGDRASGMAPLEEAVELLASSPSRVVYARALIDLGAVLRRSARRTEAREPLARALELTAASGATVLATEAQAELLAAGARPRRIERSGASALTPRERRVAALAAEGLTSAEIAQQLFVARKTVDTHLHNSYRKLGIGSRGELVGLFADETPASGRREGAS